MRTAIFGGTFNPVHNGHLRLARAYFDALPLERMLVTPTRIPPHKPDGELADARHRLRMCQLAFSGMPECQVSDIELRRRRISYTVDTLEELRRLYPEDTFYLLMGSDMFLTLDVWKSYRRILELAVVCAGAREPEVRPALEAKKRVLEEMGARCELISLDPMVVSSTELRRRVATGLDLGALVPRAVADYIARNGLYRNSLAEEETR